LLRLALASRSSHLNRAEASRGAELHRSIVKEDAMGKYERNVYRSLGFFRSMGVFLPLECTKALKERARLIDESAAKKEAVSQR